MEVTLQAIPLDKFPKEKLKELYGARIDEVLKFMLYKGIRYIPAIGYSTYMLLPSYDTPMDYFLRLSSVYDRVLINAYKWLRMKVQGQVLRQTA